MWTITGWALAVWLRVTLLLALGVGVVWSVYGTESGWFVLAVSGAGLVEIWAVRQLIREWAYEARSSWWWAP